MTTTLGPHAGTPLKDNKEGKMFPIAWPSGSKPENCMEILCKEKEVAQMVKNLPAMQETPVQSLGQEDPLEKGMAIHSSIFAQRIPSIEETGGLQPMGSQRVRHDWEINTGN